MTMRLIGDYLPGIDFWLRSRRVAEALVQSGPLSDALTGLTLSRFATGAQYVV